MFVEASATLLLINAAASIAGPVIAASVTGRFGMPTLFLYTAAVHLALAAFVIARIRIAGPATHGERFEPMPQQASPTALALDPRGETPAEVG
jgi:hypothetical protein